MTSLIRQTCATSGKRDADVRAWLGVGQGVGVGLR